MCCGWPIAEKVTMVVVTWAPHRTGKACIIAWDGSLGIVLYSPGFASGLNDGASKTSQIRSAVVG
jgi:hypothetical protein